MEVKKNKKIIASIIVLVIILLSLLVLIENFIYNLLVKIMNTGLAIIVNK